MGVLASCDVLLVFFFRHRLVLPLLILRLLMRGTTRRVIDRHICNRVAIRTVRFTGHKVLLGLTSGAFWVGPCGILPANDLL